MARSAASFRQSDVTRAVKALRAAGYQVGGVEVKRDGFRILVATDTPADCGDNLDQELAQWSKSNSRD
jgi:hypothetical protein